jgi:AraC-like DNA-binding protein
MSQRSEHTRMREEDAETVSFVHEVGEASRPFFLVDLPARAFLFESEEFRESGSYSVDLRWGKNSRQGKKTVFIKASFFFVGQGGFRHAELGEGGHGVCHELHFTLFCHRTSMQAPRHLLHKSPRLTIHGGGAYCAARGVDFPPHRHLAWELVYYRTGAPVCMMADESRHGHAGMVWLTPPGVTHSELAVTEYSNYYIHAAIQIPSRWPTFLDDDTDRSLERVFRQIVVELGSTAPGRGRMLELLAQQLELLLDRLAKEHVLPWPEQAVARAERVIELKHGQPLTLREVAAAVNASPSALRAYFRARRGCSPRDYLRQVRVDRVVSLLRTSSLKLEAISALCGFDSPSHLTRTIKKVLRKTPGQIRAG